MKGPTNDELRLALGELTPEECRLARAAYRLGWYRRGEQDYKDATAMADGGLEVKQVRLVEAK